MPERRYTDEEAREILRRAMESEQAAEGGLSHDDLIDAAAEVGIDPAAMRRAADELRVEREALQVLEERKRGKRRRWLGSLATFGVVNGFLYALDMVTSGGTWFYYPLLIWGAFVALSGLRAWLPEAEDKRRKVLGKEVERIRRREAREARMRAKEARRRTNRGVEAQIEAAIEDGVAALLGAAARGIRGALSAPPTAPGEFQQYVDVQKGKRSAQPAQPAPDFEVRAPRSRVDAERHELEEEEVVQARARRTADS